MSATLTAPPVVPQAIPAADLAIKLRRLPAPLSKLNVLAICEEFNFNVYEDAEVERHKQLMQAAYDARLRQRFQFWRKLFMLFLLLMLISVIAIPSTVMAYLVLAAMSASGLAFVVADRKRTTGSGWQLHCADYYVRVTKNTPLVVRNIIDQLEEHTRGTLKLEIEALGPDPFLWVSDLRAGPISRICIGAWDENRLDAPLLGRPA